MKKVERNRGIKAEQLVKFIMLQTDLVDVVPDYHQKFDFFAVDLLNPNVKIGVIVKETGLQESEVSKKYRLLMQRVSHSHDILCIIFIFIDIDNMIGFFRVSNKANTMSEPLLPLEMEIFKYEISNSISMLRKAEISNFPHAIAVSKAQVPMVRPGKPIAIAKAVHIKTVFHEAGKVAASSVKKRKNK